MKGPLWVSVIHVHFYVTIIYLQIRRKDVEIDAQNNHILLYKINPEESSYRFKKIVKYINI